MRTVERRKIRDVVAMRLEEYIAARKLKPGDRLPTETEFANRFGVSRLSLREATKALEFLGIVEAKPGRGLSVGRMSLERVTGHLTFHPALQDSPALELIASRVVIETGVLPFVIERMAEDPGIHERLHEINDDLRGTRKLNRWIEFDVAFHRGLVEASGLSPVLAFADLLAVFFQRFRESVEKAAWKRGIESHHRLLEALRAGRLDAARHELTAHIESHRKRLETGP